MLSLVACRYVSAIKAVKAGRMPAPLNQQSGRKPPERQAFAGRQYLFRSRREMSVHVPVLRSRQNGIFLAQMQRSRYPGGQRMSRPPIKWTCM